MKTHKAPTRISTISPLRKIVVPSLALILLAGCDESPPNEVPKAQTEVGEVGEKTELQGKLDAALAYDGPALGRHNVLADLEPERRPMPVRETSPLKQSKAWTTRS